MVVINRARQTHVSVVLKAQVIDKTDQPRKASKIYV